VSVKNLFDLAGKTALVTGGSRGLGLEIATALGEAGASVAITARREQWLTPAAEQLRTHGVDCLAIACSVTDPGQVDAAVANTLARYGGIDILVNNAGVSWGAPVESMPLEKWRDVLETNATGAFLMAQRVGREMIAAARGGAIINIASVAGLIGTPGDMLDAVGYSASKGALVSFTRDLAVKWARHQIRVNAIAPGFFDTRLSAGVLKERRAQIERWTPMARVGGAGEIGGVALFLASPASSYVTGQVLAVDGGMTAW
jgi:gluconate 5-dehydrogenase